MAAKTPQVAPFESCVACFKGDTTTGVAVRGEFEFTSPRFTRVAGIPLDEAAATGKVLAAQEMGCDPGMVPVGEFTVAIRLCRDCAAKTGTPVADRSLGALPGYSQDEMYGGSLEDVFGADDEAS